MKCVPILFLLALVLSSTMAAVERVSADGTGPWGSSSQWDRQSWQLKGYDPEAESYMGSGYQRLQAHPVPSTSPSILIETGIAITVIAIVLIVAYLLMTEKTPEQVLNENSVETQHTQNPR